MVDHNRFIREKMGKYLVEYWLMVDHNRFIRDKMGKYWVEYWKILILLKTPIYVWAQYFKLCIIL